MNEFSRFQAEIIKVWAKVQKLNSNKIKTKSLSQFDGTKMDSKINTEDSR